MDIEHRAGAMPDFGKAAGIRAETPKHQFGVAVNPYVRTNDLSSGLLPLIQGLPAGLVG